MRYRGETRPAIRRGSIREFFSGDPNLKGCWSLDGHARDHSGNGNHGTVYGAVPYIGKFDRAYYYNGNNDYISVGNFSTFTNFTVLFWMNPKSIAGDIRIISNITSPPSGYGFSLRFWDNGHIEIWGNNWQRLTNSPILANTWSCGVVTVASATTATGYINGRKERQISNVYELGQNVGIGAAYWLIYGYNFYGRLDETAIFSRALSPSEISQYYQWAISEPRKYWFYSPVVAGVYMDSYFYRHLMAGGK